MRKVILILVFLTIPYCFYGQSKKELKKMNSELITVNNELANDFTALNKKYNALNKKYTALNKKYNALNKKYTALNEKHSVSFDTPENYAKSIFKLLKSKKKNEASKLLMSLDDSNFFPDKLSQVLKEEADRDSTSISDWMQSWNDECKSSFDEVYYKGLNLGINWQSAVFTKAEFKIEYDADIDTYVIDSYMVFFKSSNKDYSFRIDRAFIINDKPNNWKLRGPYDLQAQKLKEAERERERLEREKQKAIELKNKPYTPWGVRVNGANWHYTDKTFTEFRIKIVNDTEHIVDRVKFQLSIYTGAEYSGGTKSFSKTYDLTYYVPRGYSSGGSERLYLEPGDVQEIQIQELRDFFLGEDIGSQKNWYIKTEVIEVYPKHNEN